MRRSTWLLMGCIAAIAAAPVPQVGPVQTKPEEELRSRARDFNQALLKGKYDDAIKFLDPEVVTAVGEETAKQRLQQPIDTIKGITGLLGRKITGFQIRKTEVSKDKEKGTVTAVVTIGFATASTGTGADRHESLSTQHWLFKNKLWYFVR